MHASSPPPGPLSASIMVEALRAHTGALVACALILHAILWTIAPGISEPTPDPKIAAGLAIGREWVLGYPGLPVLAPWVLGGLYLLIPSILLMKALGPAAVALAGWYVFSLARSILGEQHGALATLLMVGAAPVSFPVGALDSAAIQMPLIAGMVLAWWRAMREGSRAIWLIFAATAALCFYAGAQGIVVLALLAVLSLTGSGKALFRKSGSRASMPLAIVVFVLIAAPRLIWLALHNFTGLYEDSAAGFETLGVLKSYEAAGGALAGHLGLLLLVAVATPILLSSRIDTVSFTRAPLSGFVAATGILLAVVPFVVAALAAILLGLRLTIDAFAPLLMYSGLLVFLLAGETVRICRQYLTVTLAALFLLLPPLASITLNFAAPWAGRALMTAWPAAAAAKTMNESFSNRTGKPLSLLIGPPLYAAAIAIESRDRPHVFPNADPSLASWVGEGALSGQGAVVFWPIAGTDAAPPKSLTSVLPPFVPEAPLSLLWALPGNVDPVRIGWGILPPAEKPK